MNTPNGARVAVLMPTFEQADFIARAVESLLAQSVGDWELQIVDDGSQDHTQAALAPYLADARIRYLRLPRNQGLGAALNRALDATSVPCIAYLPSDDVWYADHLERLLACLERDPQAVLAYAGMRYRYNRRVPGIADAHGLQLVQVLHRRTPDRWMERDELTTDDLDRMYWSRLARRGGFVAAGAVSCEWVDHAQQRHRLIREPEGGINAYRQHYRVEAPLRFHSTVGQLIDEPGQYARFRAAAAPPPAFDRLKILLVGELAYNAERIVALEELGHRLYGLWMRRPHWYNTVGPLPFGHVEDVPYENWQEAVRRIDPDVIYALLNWQAVPFAHRVLAENPGIPFVWHFKEGPFICMERGTWPQLMQLYARADGQVFTSPEMAEWFDLAGLAGMSEAPRLVLDGDLPKRDWFDGTPSPRLSERDGELHTVVPGRPIGLHPHDVATLAAGGIHLHFYGDFTHGQWRGWIEKAAALAPRHLHLHANVDASGWLAEFSRYDAGWLHCFRSTNDGDLRRADWDDLNYPARLGTLACAGLPLLQRDNRHARVATQSLVREIDAGVFFDRLEELPERLADAGEMARLRANMWRARSRFTFDYHAAGLAEFLRRVAAGRRGTRAARTAASAS